MGRRALIVALMIVSTGSADADSPKLAEARRAIDGVHYADAQRLLLAALQDGGNSPAAVRELYKLSASTAIVLGHRDDGEQFYRRWLALEPTATLSDDVSPKLREAFDAARSFAAAHGALVVMAGRDPSGAIEVVVQSDPLAMATAVATLDGDAIGARVAPGPDHRAHLPPAANGARVAVLDQLGNRLVELAPAPTATPPIAAGATPAPPIEPPVPEPTRPIAKRWTTWALPTLVGLVAGYLCYQYEVNNDKTLDQHSKNELYVGVGAGAVVAVGFGIPMTIFLFDTKAAQVAAVAPGAGAGIMYTGRF